MIYFPKCPISSTIQSCAPNVASHYFILVIEAQYAGKKKILLSGAFAVHLSPLVFLATICENTMTERADQLHHDNAPVHSTALVQAFLAKHHITQVCQPPYIPDLAPCDFRLFPKLKSPLKWRRFMNATVTQYTSSVNGVSLPTD
jgi:hypothetical protein